MSVIRDGIPSAPGIVIAPARVLRWEVPRVPHGITIASPRLQPASLDHTIWFHRPFRADEWWLYDQFSPFAGGGRGLALARVFSQSGELVATVAQEGLIRLHDGRP